MIEIFGIKIYKKWIDRAKNIALLSLLTIVFCLLNENLQTEKKVKKLSNKVQEKEVQIIKDKKEIESISEELFEKDKKIKEVSTFIKVETEVKIVEKLIPFVDTFETKDTILITKNNRDSFIKVPTTVKWKDSGASIQITVQKSGVVIDSLIISDSVAYRIVKKKTFFGTKTYIQSTRTSPFVKDKNTDAYVLKESPSLKTVITRFLIIGFGIYGVINLL